MTDHPTYDDLIEEMEERRLLEEDHWRIDSGFDPDDCSGVFDSFGVVSDADPGL